MSTLKQYDPERFDKDIWSEHWQAYANSAGENPAAKMRHAIILERLQSLPEKPGLLLDVGSGQGDCLYRAVASQCAKKYVGFELSEVGVSISRSKVPQAEFFQVDLFSPPNDISWLIGQCDVVICSDVIEHVDEPEDFCCLLKDYLKPGAYLYVTVPGGPMSDFDRHIGHRTHYDEASIIRLLTVAGFIVEKVFLAGFPFFNLYRMMVILRGKRLIFDVKSDAENSASGFIARLMMQIFGILFKLNMSHSQFGWQIFAVARCPD